MERAFILILSGEYKQIIPYEWALLQRGRMNEVAGGGWSCISASSSLSRERQHRVPPQPLRHNHLAVNINAVNLKHRLRQIETDERRRHRTISPMKKTSCPSNGAAAPEPGDVHLITLSVAQSFFESYLLTEKVVPGARGDMFGKPGYSGVQKLCGDFFHSRHQTPIRQSLSGRQSQPRRHAPVS
jgi:hypothetical protein